MVETGEPQRATSHPGSAYVPVRLVELLEREPKGEVRFDGTVVVADVAEYSKLVDRYSRRREDGIEQLRHILDGAFASALDTVDSYGGEVVYFAGDALICYWRATPGWIRRDVAQAAACARALAGLGRHLDPFTDQALSLHVGVATGPIWAARLGGWSGRRNLLFGGESTRAAFAAMRSARAGEVWASASVLSELRIELRGRIAPHEPRPADDWLDRLHTAGTLPAPQHTASEGRGHSVRHLELLPAAIQHRVETEDGEWTAEIREVDCLFVNIPELNEAHEGARQRFGEVLHVIEACLKTTSIAGRLVIDDRGLTIVWVAGEPMVAQHRDPRQSIRLAADLLRRLRERGFRPGAGLASGRALCGTFGNTSRRDVAVVGPPMVLAARLMEDAGEGLLVTGVDDDAASLVNLPALELKRRIKGFAGEIPVFRADLEGSNRLGVASPGDDALVGRTRELSVLAGCLDELQRGRGALCLVNGPAGIGKSFFVSAIQRAAETRGIQTHVGEAFGAEGRAPYSVWRPVFRALFSDLPFDAPRTFRERLRGQLADLGLALDSDRLDLVTSVFPVSSDGEPTVGPSGDDRALATRDVLVEVLAHRCSRPTLIVLEDLHNIDSPSKQLLELAASRLKGVLFVVTTRPALHSDLGDRFLRQVDLHLDLPPMSAADVTAMAEQVVGLQISEAVAREINERANGIPLYVRGYLTTAYHALPRNARQGPLNELPAGVLDLLATPDPVKGILTRIFAGLSRDENRVIKTASVVGQRCSLRVVAEVLREVDAAVELREALDSLLARSIVRMDSPDGEAFHFSHSLIQLTCYETIPVTHRRKLHLVTAQALERLAAASGGDPSDELLVSLAHHYGCGGDAERTIEYAEKAAWRARRQGAYREVLRLLDQCLDAWPKLTDGASADRRIRWHRLKSEAAGALGDREGRIREAEAAIRHAGRRPSRWRMLAALIALGRILRRARRRSKVHVDAAPRTSPEAGVERELARIYRQMAIGAYFAGDGLQIAYNTTAALHHAERAGRSPELAYALASMGTCLGLIGFTTPGRLHLDAATNLALALNASGPLIYANLVSALLSIGRGEWDRVREHADQTQDAATREGNTSDWGNAQALRFWMHLYRGQAEEAEASAVLLQQFAKRNGNPQQRSWAERFLALGKMRNHQWHAARVHLVHARELFVEAEQRQGLVRPLYELVPLIADLGLAVSKLGEEGAGRALGEKALRDFLRARRPAGHAVLEGYSSLAELLIGDGRDPKDGTSGMANVPPRTARRVLLLLKRYCRVFPIGRPRYALWRGHWLRASGNDRAAQECWQAAHSDAGSLGMGHDAKLLAEALAALRPDA